MDCGKLLRKKESKMLLLSRHVDESIRLTVRDADGNIQSVAEFKVLEVQGKKVKLGFEASADMEIWRTEVPHIAAEDVSKFFSQKHDRKPKPEEEVQGKVKSVDEPAEEDVKDV